MIFLPLDSDVISFWNFSQTLLDILPTTCATQKRGHLFFIGTVLLPPMIETYAFLSSNWINFKPSFFGVKIQKLIYGDSPSRPEKKRKRKKNTSQLM